MKSSSSNEIKRGQAISFRVPSDTPDHLLKHLQRLKEIERRNFSSKIAEFVLRGVGETSSKERETITVPLPHKLSKSQRDWLKHEHSEALLGTIVYQLLNDPIRATALMTSLNSNSININEALYLQEDEEFPETETPHDSFPVIKETAVTIETDKMDDLDAFEWNSVEHNQPITEEEEENDLDHLLGDFLSKMNK
ncbi:hypothetical protein [Robertmurraya massiliosenegalensis]|uniref:hypothetical protein n=1 Tax=Robertmurraya massiliosenegalensis TaxID=1287657 RepID=UPI0002D4DBB5|nr:hypothetical protein [Robertmurraya massiliosenegalensis]